MPSENKQSYSEKLKDPRWQKRRLKILERDHWMCAICGDGESTLHVHHWRYIHGQEPWEASDDDLSALCESCHAQETEFRKESEEVLIEALRIRHATASQVHDLACAVFGFKLPTDDLTTFIDSYQRSPQIKKAFRDWVHSKGIALSAEGVSNQP